QTATEVYSVTVADPFGSTTSQDVTITIGGANDVVMIGAAEVLGQMAEDAPEQALRSQVAAGTIGFSDVDLNDEHTAAFAAAAANAMALGVFALGSVAEAPGAADGAVRWTYTLDNSAAQSLAEGQSATELYRVGIADPFGSTASQDVTITIRGT